MAGRSASLQRCRRSCVKHEFNSKACFTGTIDRFVTGLYGT